MFLKNSKNSQENISLQLYLKSNSDTGVFLWILWNFQEHLFYRTPLVAASGYICFLGFRSEADSILLPFIKISPVYLRQQLEIKDVTVATLLFTKHWEYWPMFYNIMENYKALVLTAFKNHNNTKTKSQTINDKSSKNYILK